MNQLQLHSSANTKQKYEIKNNEINYANIFVRNYRKKAAKLVFPCKTKIKQLIQKIANRMLITESNLALILQGHVVEKEKEEIQLYDGLIFHVVDIKRVNIPSINFSVKRIQPNATAYSYTVSSQMKIGQFISNYLVKQFRDPQNYFLVYVGKQLNISKTFAQELVEQCSEILAIHRIENLKSQTCDFKRREKNNSLKNNAQAQKEHQNRNPNLFQKGVYISNEKAENFQTNQKYKNTPTAHNCWQNLRSNDQQQGQVKKNENNNTETLQQLFSTAKFNHPHEKISISKNQQNKQGLNAIQKSLSQNSADQTQEIIIGNYTAFSHLEKVEESSKGISTKYGLVPNKFTKLDRNQNEKNRNTNAFFDENSIIAIKDEQAQDQFLQNSGQLQKQYYEPNNNQEKTHTFIKKEQQKLAGTLKTISSHYDEQLSQSLQQSNRIAVFDQIDGSQSIIRNSSESLKYRKDLSSKQEQVHRSDPCSNLTQSQNYPREGQEVTMKQNFAKKNKRSKGLNGQTNQSQNEFMEPENYEVLRSLPNPKTQHQPNHTTSQIESVPNLEKQKMYSMDATKNNHNLGNEALNRNQNQAVASVKRTLSYNQSENQDVKLDGNITAKQTDLAQKNHSEVYSYKIKQKEEEAQSLKGKHLKTSMEQNLEKMVETSRDAENKKLQYLSGISETSSYYQSSNPNSNNYLKNSDQMVKLPQFELNKLKVSFTSDYHKSLEKQWEGKSLESDHIVINSLTENQGSIPQTDFIQETNSSNSRFQEEAIDEVLMSGTKFSNKSSMSKKNKVEIIENLNGEQLVVESQQATTKNYQNYQNESQNQNILTVAQQKIDLQKLSSEFRQQSTKWQEEPEISIFQQSNKQLQNLNQENSNQPIVNLQKQKTQKSINNLEILQEKQMADEQSLLLSGSKTSNNRIVSEQNLLESIQDVAPKKHQQLNKEKPEKDQNVDASIDAELENENLINYVSNSNKKGLNQQLICQQLEDLHNQYQLYQGNVHPFNGYHNAKTFNSANQLTQYHGLKIGDAIVILNNLEKEAEQKGRFEAQFKKNQLISSDQIRSQIFLEFYKIQSGGTLQDLIMQNENIQVAKEPKIQIAQQRQDQENLLLDYL